ncbi:exodeoxyribonuclease VII small subunit [Thermoflexus sp.]|uniref:exodeoxyribonuclease VII small subunit n=1 Tax=Thermoflexus sp. TaxID=1969742 RepID=UPI0025F87BCC|nr:exodeoxyribonuclease VII small subunit [Thermoflexus sp.]MDW8180571.1 exodeoxyribonuclease VII small subunit [Anaerolineae bacterium]MCS6964158.1 exodeoxyribonuclease VII small subunit [Thermoflexus sp.]MCS7351118.1 exodeoxyribonuclease VII small subunit [Thermoflexus sp.]MCX7689889.1 exodeoxyribonuclease VII small subunit [Thermoflexus sp.]MDW8185699.1 exodeoxyribonuclease VII small subunit [Anaerolineae bacterium]
MSKAIHELTFEEALAELEHIVRALEGGGLPLEETMALYERGRALADRCQQLLQEAQLRVQLLERNESGAIHLTPFEG